jgi:prolyl 4-hydroxylase
MIYLSNVDLGGHTIFPQAGISVKPVEGSALFWFNVGPKTNYDSRVFHLGCPVIIGNKWIANKWVKWNPQYKKFLCFHDRKHYSTSEL